MSDFRSGIACFALRIGLRLRFEIAVAGRGGCRENAFAIVIDETEVDAIACDGGIDVVPCATSFALPVPVTCWIS